MVDGLKRIFGKYGAIVSTFVKIDIVQRKPYAFVSFDQHDAAKQAIKELGYGLSSSNHSFCSSQSSSDPLNTGVPIYVTWAQTKKDRQRTREGNQKDRYIYLQNLKQELNEEMVRAAFQKYGEIAATRLSKLNIAPFMGTIKIGYIVFKMAISANQTINKFENDPDILQLFDGNPVVSFLYPPSYLNRDKKQGQQRRANPRIP